MDFRKILYIKKKDFNWNIDMTQEAKDNINKVNLDDCLVLRIRIDKDYVLHIEYADLLNVDNIRKACEE